MLREELPDGAAKSKGGHRVGAKQKLPPEEILKAGILTPAPAHCPGGMWAF